MSSRIKRDFGEPHNKLYMLVVYGITEGQINEV